MQWTRLCQIEANLLYGPRGVGTERNTLPDIWILIAVVLVAGLIQGTTGFGFGLFSMGMFIMMMPIGDAVVIAAIIVLFSGLLNLWSVRHNILWSEAWPLLATALPATFLGIYLLKNLDGEILKTGVAVMILTGCAVTLGSSKEARIHRATPWGHVAGAIGGLFGGALNMGGPTVVLYTLFRGWEKAEAKGVMSVYFAATAILRIALLVLTGVATPEGVRRGLLLLGPGLLASYAGTRLFRRMSTQAFRYAAMAILVGLAAKILFL